MDGDDPGPAAGFAGRLKAGRAARAAGDFATAATHFRAAVLARPGQVGARLDLAHVLLKLGDAVAAAELAAAVVVKVPGDPLAHLRLGEARRALGDLAGALAAFAAAMAADPHHVRAQAEHAAALRQLGVAAGSPPPCPSAPIPPRSETVATRVAALRARGEPEAARAALAGDPELGRDPGIWFAAIDLDIAEGRFDAAAAALAAPPAATGRAAARPHLAAARLAAALWDPVAALGHHAAALAVDPALGRRTALERARSALLALDPLAGRRALRDAAGDAASRPAQLLEEAGIELGVLARLVALRPLSPVDRLAPLRVIAAEAPEVTLVAAVLLLTLRQTGGLADAGGGAGDAIPSRVASLGAAPQGWPPAVEPVAFDPATAMQFLQAHSGPETAAAYVRADPVRRLDLLRLGWLHAAGGLWVDPGLRPRRDAPPAWLPGGARFAVSLDAGATLDTGWLAAAPGDPVIARALAEATHSVLEGARESAWLATGGGPLTRAFVAEFVAATDPAGWLRQRAVLDAHCFALARPAGPLAPGTRIMLDLPDLAALA